MVLRFGELGRGAQRTLLSEGIDALVQYAQNHLIPELEEIIEKKRKTAQSLEEQNIPRKIKQREKEIKNTHVIDYKTNYYVSDLKKEVKELKEKEGRMHYLRKYVSGLEERKLVYQNLIEKVPKEISLRRYELKEKHIRKILKLPRQDLTVKITCFPPLAHP